MNSATNDFDRAVAQQKFELASQALVDRNNELGFAAANVDRAEQVLANNNQILNNNNELLTSVMDENVDFS